MYHDRFDAPLDQEQGHSSLPIKHDALASHKNQRSKLRRLSGRVASLLLSGALLGGAYEYLCSWVGEKVFGVIFWDYSHIPFNLNGRVNLLYCLFWGIAAVAWVKVVYPRLSRLVERFIGRKHRVFASIVTAFMVVDIVLSAAALVRYGQRQEGDRTPTNVVEQFLDEHYDDAYLEHRYQNMKLAQ